MSSKTLGIIPASMLVILSACGGSPPYSPVARDTATNTCYTEIITPAVIDTVTETRQTGTGKYETKRVQRIVSDRVVTRIDLVCPELQTVEFIASVQRAFKARHLYGGKITGTWTADTKTALLDFQTVRGYASTDITLATAQELGLAITPVK